MERFYLLLPALLLLAVFVIGFVAYCGLCAAGRAPKLEGVKHNQLFGPFLGSFMAWLIGPLERALLGRVSPNQITAASLAMCALTGLAAGLGHVPGAAWLFGLAGILDILDGRLARLAGKQTAAGALLDSVSDRWGELFVFSGYAWLLHDSPWLLAVLAAIGGSMMVSYTRARAEGLGISLSGGMMQRAERVVLVAFGTLIAAWYGAEATAPIIGVTMLLTGAGSIATALNRWIVAYRALGERVMAEQPVVRSALGEPSAAVPPTTIALPAPARGRAVLADQ